MEPGLDEIQQVKSTTIKELISKLQNIMSKQGDIPVVFWDQTQACKYDNIDNAIVYSQNNNAVFLGGFHVNADKYYDIDINPDFRVLSESELL